MSLHVLGINHQTAPVALREKVAFAPDALAAALASLRALPQVHALPGAQALLTLAPAGLTAGRAVPADQALPLYIRDKVAQTTAERAAARSAPAQTP